MTATQNTPTNPTNRIYLKDYQAPDFSVSQVYLDIKLFDDHAIVYSDLVMYRQIDSADGEIVLYGRDLELEAIFIDNIELSKSDYHLDSEQLVIAKMPNGDALPSKLRVKTVVKIIPQKNTSLEGLYIAGDGDNFEVDTMFVTQCEPEGFRKITFFPDRPDVLAEYTTRLESDKKYPTLLANGNLLEQGNVEGDDSRHYSIWHDPTKKPSYLFACVFADLDVLQDNYTTAEGREVLLEIYTKKKDIEKCHVAMQALKDSMLWDEEHYGLCYDLDRYMIVAVSQFNMGAMENKGLNIFNTACVLSSPETTTDPRTFSVKAIIAHEYFHNWTGNRITCRNWFQLCLKEGFTVYRDQSFSANHQSPAVQRIEDVGILRSAQFSEDAGALAHPVRPESFVEINNFYTATVYEKGAEIVRMIANMLGEQKFRQGTDEYFRLYDGQAVTVEDFLSAMSVADERVLDFITWYRQPGTPEVTVQNKYDAQKGTMTLHLTQYTRHVAGYDAPVALPIPISTALFDRQTGEILSEKTILLTQASQEFVFEEVKTGDNQEPVLSLLRDFSAPVNLKMQYSADDLAFLLEHETNGFNQWQATQGLVNMVLKDESKLDSYLTAVKKGISKLAKTDPMLASRLLDIPAEREMATLVDDNYDPEAIKAKRDWLKQALANALQADFFDLYQELPIQDFTDTPTVRGERALRNTALGILMKADHADEQVEKQVNEWALTQYHNAKCMTERLGALHTMVEYQHPSANECLQDFYQRFADEQLVIDLWFAVQSGAESVGIEQVQQLIEHKDFDWGTPNRVNAVMRGLAGRPVDFWSQAGLELYTSVVARLDSMNPTLASRLLQPFARWHTLVDDKKAIAKEKLTKLRSQITSKNTCENLDNILAI